MTAALDHLVLAAPTLEAGIGHVEQRLGARAAPGGRHPAWGTHNALLSLGARCYLEIVAPEPGAPSPGGGRPFALDALAGPRLVTWCASASDLESLVARAARDRVDLGAAMRRSRLRPDGGELSWTMTDPLVPRHDGLVPFFIDWGTSPHPAGGAPPAGHLGSLRAEHPDPEPVRRALRALALDLDVAPGPAPALIAVIITPRGAVELR